MSAKSDATGKLVSQWMQTARLIQRRVFRAGKFGNVNPLQMHALFIVHENDGLTMKELAKHLQITSPSATSLVNRLVRMKWVTRISDPKNRKLVRLKIAPIGKSFMEAKMKDIGGAMHGVLSLLDARDQSDFGRILKNLHQSLAHDAHK